MVRLPVHPAALEVADLEVGELADAVTGQVTGQVQRLLAVCNGELSRAELQETLGLRHRDNFIEAYLQPALNAGLLEMTISDKPRSSKQKYRLTEKGRGQSVIRLVAAIESGGPTALLANQVQGGSRLGHLRAGQADSDGSEKR
jgi:hypothetical protein